MGGRVRRIAVLRDEIDAIAGEVKASLERRSELIFTCGGLGPTDDDLTLAAISQATARKLEVNPSAHESVERGYRELASQGYVSRGEMSRARLKVDRLAEAAQAVDDMVRPATAVVADCDDTRVRS